MPRVMTSMTACRAAPNRAGLLPRGFTLIELIVVIVLAATISVVAIARTATSYQVSQRAAARLLQIDLTHVRDRAVSTGRATWAQIQPGSERVVYLQTPAGAAMTLAAATALLDPATNTQMTTVFDADTSGMSLSGVAIATAGGSVNTQSVGFDFRGRPVESTGVFRKSDFAIVITASRGATTFPDISVIITPETGAIRVSP